jgi:hypothetical protein
MYIKSLNRNNTYKVQIGINNFHVDIHKYLRKYTIQLIHTFDLHRQYAATKNISKFFGSSNLILQ